jgi:hypothetical protein
LLENYYLPGDLENQIETFVADYNNCCQRPAESPQFGACNFPHFGGGGDQPVE